MCWESDDVKGSLLIVLGIMMAWWLFLKMRHTEVFTGQMAQLMEFTLKYSSEQTKRMKILKQNCQMSKLNDGSLLCYFLYFL